MHPVGPFQLVIMGVCGSGKTVLAGRLATRLGAAVAEADAYHSSASIAKMSSGLPLDDADRWPWLQKLASWMGKRSVLGLPTVMTCSALKRSYRDVLRSSAPHATFIHLDGTRELLLGRLAGRQGHFMPASLLDSQLAILEPLGPDERGAQFGIDQSPEALAEEVMAYLVRMR